MALQLHRSRPGAKDVRRIARQEIAKALEALDGKTPSDEDIHTARKDLKKARAMLRLLRQALGKARYRRENAALRDAARPLSQIRDSKILIDTLDKLIERFGAPARAVPTDRVRRELSRERTAVRRNTLNGATSLEKERRLLQTAQQRAARWRVGGQGWSVLGSGLKRVYAQARTAFTSAEADPSDENLHEWRKQTKYLWHELQVLEPLRPQILGKLANELHQLSDYLGEDHDLAVLRAKVLQMQDVLPESVARDELLALIDPHRAELHEKAIVLGHKLYAEKSAAFERRLAKYWQGWRR